MKTNYLTTKEAAEYLKVSISQMYNLTYKKLISYYKPTGKLNYFKQEDLDSFIARNKELSFEDQINLLKRK